MSSFDEAARSEGVRRLRDLADFLSHLAKPPRVDRTAGPAAHGRCGWAGDSRASRDRRIDEGRCRVEREDANSSVPGGACRASRRTAKRSPPSPGSRSGRAASANFARRALTSKNSGRSRYRLSALPKTSGWQRPRSGCSRQAGVQSPVAAQSACLTRRLSYITANTARARVIPTYVVALLSSRPRNGKSSRRTTSDSKPLNAATVENCTAFR